MAVTSDSTTNSPAKPAEDRGVDRGDAAAIDAPAADRTAQGERKGPLRWRSGKRFAPTGAGEPATRAEAASGAAPASAEAGMAPAAATVPGPSLARPPALALGTILLAAGLYFLYRQHTFTPLSNFPGGAARTGGNAFLGIFGVNGWTGMLTAIAGGLLLFGAAQHLLAKTMSLIVALALGAAAIIALARSGNVLGLAAANGWTETGWGASALILLVNAFLPRTRRRVPAEGPGQALAAAPAPGIEEAPATEGPRARAGGTR